MNILEEILKLMVSILKLFVLIPFNWYFINLNMLITESFFLKMQR